MWLDSYFPSLYIHIRDGLTKNHWPTFLAATSLWYGGIVGGANLREPNPRASMHEYGARPVYIVHGGNDGRVDAKYARELADIVTNNGGTAHLWIVADNPHAGVIWRNVNEYEERMVNFFNETLVANTP